MATWGRRNDRRRTPSPRTPARTERASRTTKQYPVTEKSELRNAVEGREHDFIGFGLVAVGVLLGLAIYFGLAGPLGRGIEIVIGWFAGLGRFAVPVALIAVGVAFIRDGKAAAPVRLALGWMLLAAAGLGLLHLINGPDRVTASFDAVGDAGGWVGALLAEPLRALLAVAGAVVVLV
ncbi:MAG: hypothetical protein H0X61_02835, partial [Acidimicrobiia bacterium]|nr:hypothetical protein [Acidimicrobiia bacterium]